MPLRLVHSRAPVQAAAPCAGVGLARSLGITSSYVTDRSIVTTARLILRPLTSCDEGAFLEAVLAARADLNEFCPLHRGEETDAHLFERHVAMSAAAATTGKAIRLVITRVREPRRIIGAINLNAITRGLESRGAANWWLVPSARRRGIAFEAVQALFDHALGDLPLGHGLQRIDALIEPGNVASLRLAERLRMRPQPGQYERLVIRGDAKVHQLYSAFAQLSPLAASMIELKPLPGLEAILRGSIRI